MKEWRDSEGVARVGGDAEGAVFPCDGVSEHEDVSTLSPVLAPGVADAPKVQAVVGAGADERDVVVEIFAAILRHNPYACITLPPYLACKT